jgi:DNA polymerase IV
VASVGVAPNKFLAKIASDFQKPDGFVVVEPQDVQAFLDPLPVGRLWGVGRVGNQRLEALGIRTIGQLRRLPVDMLTAQFGSWGEPLWELAHGQDDRPVVPDHEAKSISHETTFAADIDDQEILRAWLLDLTDQVARRLRRHGLKGRTVQLKLRLADFRLATASQTLPVATNITNELWHAAADLLEQRARTLRLPIRLLGMGVSGLETPGQTQLMLFDEPTRQRNTRLDAVTDAIRDRYGDSAIARAKALKKQSAVSTQQSGGCNQKSASSRDPDP